MRHPHRFAIALAALGATTLLQGWLAALQLASAAPGALPVRPSTDAAALVAQINQAQQIIDSASSPAASLEDAGRYEQLAFRELVDSKALRQPTLAALTPAARSPAEADLRAADALSHIVPPAPGFPNWHIVAPPPPGTLLGYFRSAARSSGIPWRYLAAVEFVETRMGRIRGASPAGAQGPMQFMPSTWAQYGSGSIDSQHDAIAAAARYLAANGGRNSISAALYHYNPSRSYVAAVEAYADAMRDDARNFYGFYYWRVLYRTVRGVFVLPMGYPQQQPERLP
jgi:hypothetical protein